MNNTFSRTSFADGNSSTLRGAEELMRQGVMMIVLSLFCRYGAELNEGKTRLEKMIETKRLKIYPAARERMEALKQPGVKRVEAETEPDNRASQRVLEKCGFLPTGTVGEEGPRFYRTVCG